MLKALYTIAIGLLFAAFVGFGIDTFYSAPTYPDCGEVRVKTPAIIGEVKERTPAEQIEDQKCRNLQDAFQDQSQNHTRNLSIIYIVISVIVLAISLFGLGKVEVIGDGVTLGGVFLLFAGIVTSFASGSEIFRFLSVTAGLAIIIFLTYWKFVRAPKTNL